MLTTYFTAIILTLPHVLIGFDYFGLEPNPVPNLFSNSQPQLYPDHIDQIGPDQCNPTSGAVFWNVPSVAEFTSTFMETASNSAILRQVFDLSQTSVLEYAEYVYKHSLDVLKGFDKAASLADAVTQVITSNFDVLTMPLMMRVKSNLAADFLYFEGVLSKDNAKSLALAYVKTFEDNARVNLTTDPTSKFPVISESFFKFISSVDPNVIKVKPMLLFYYLNQWKLESVKYKGLSQ